MGHGDGRVGMRTCAGFARRHAKWDGCQPHCPFRQLSTGMIVTTRDYYTAHKRPNASALPRESKQEKNSKTLP